MHHFANSVAWLGMSRVALYGSTFISTIYVANLLAPADYALMGVANILIGLLNHLAECGLGHAVIQKKELSDEQMVSVFWLTTLTGTFFSVICFFFSGCVETFFDSPGVSNVVRALSGILFLTSVSILPYKLMERKMRFKLKAIIDLISKLLSVLSTVVFAYLGYGVWSLVTGQLVNSLSLALFSYAFEPFRPQLLLKYKEIKSMMTFGLNILGLRVAWYTRANIDNVIGGRYLSALDFGYYSFAFKMTSNVESVFHSTMSTISLPVLARMQENDQKVNHTYLQLVRYASLLCFPVFIGIVILSPEIVTVFLARRWAPIVTILQTACFVQMVRVISSVNESLFVAVGKPNYSLKANLMQMAILAGSFLWTVKWGVTGMITTWAVMLPLFFFGWTGFTLYYRRINPVSYLKGISPALLGSVLMLTVLSFLKRTVSFQNHFPGTMGQVINMCILIIFGGIVYLGFIYIMDKSIIIGILANKSKPGIESSTQSRAVH